MSLLLELQFAEIVVRPPIGQVEDCAGRMNLLCRVQAIQKNLTLHISFSNVSKRKPKGVFHEQSARWFHQLSDLFHQRQRNG